MKIKLISYKDVSFPSLIPRQVDIWLPLQYEQDPSSRYPVLYMHDGQNLFRRHKFILRTWKVAEHVTEMSGNGVIPPVIVVGIWNTPNRMGDYLPNKPIASPEAQAKLKKVSKAYHFNVDEQVSDLYLRFIVEKIKPMIDDNFRTLTSMSQTGIMGSSMGGLISLYALTEYPQVFGMAGCLSTHWPICDDYMVPYLDKALPVPGAHRIYFDHGTEGLDKSYGSFQKKVDKLMHQKGYKEGVHWMTKVFPGEDHNETAWSGRLNIPLKFLFENKG